MRRQCATAKHNERLTSSCSFRQAGRLFSVSLLQPSRGQLGRKLDNGRHLPKFVPQLEQSALAFVVAVCRLQLSANFVISLRYNFQLAILVPTSGSNKTEIKTLFSPDVQLPASRLVRARCRRAPMGARSSLAATLVEAHAAWLYVACPTLLDAVRRKLANDCSLGGRRSGSCSVLARPPSPGPGQIACSNSLCPRPKHAPGRAACVRTTGKISGPKPDGTRIKQCLYVNLAHCAPAVGSKRASDCISWRPGGRLAQLRLFGAKVNVHGAIKKVVEPTSWASRGSGASALRFASFGRRFGALLLPFWRTRQAGRHFWTFGLSRAYDQLGEPHERHNPLEHYAPPLTLNNRNCGLISHSEIFIAPQSVACC